jgi:hypothetical protein
MLAALVKVVCITSFFDLPDSASPTVGHTTPDYPERYIVDHAPTMRPVPVHTAIEKKKETPSSFD